MAKRLALALALLAGAAHAQTQTYSCYTNVAGVTACNPTGPPPVPSPAPGGSYSPAPGSGGLALLLLQAYLAKREKLALDAPPKKDRRAERFQAVKGSVTYYVGEGKCDRAAQVALDAGEPELASMARAACVPR